MFRTTSPAMGLTRLLSYWRDRKSRQPDLGDPASADTVILLYNTCWGQLLEVAAADLPPGCAITADRRYWDRADAVVFHIPTLPWLPRRRPRPGQRWVAWSIECEEYYPQLRTPAYMRHFDLTMTHRLDADILTTYVGYYRSSDHFQQALLRPSPPKKAGQLASLFVSSRSNKSGRLAYLTALMAELEVHSFGQALRNRAIPPPDRGRETKLALVAGYKFDLAFENAVAPDYVTEKFYDPLLVGTVPVYFGAPNVDRFAPGDRCFINVADYPDPGALADYLRRLAADEAAYQAYFAWKARPLRAEFSALLAAQRVNPWVRLCHTLTAAGTVSRRSHRAPPPPGRG